MTRLQQPVQPETATAPVKPLFNQLQKQLGHIPNIFKNMANSPTALQAFMKLSELAGQASIPKPLQEELALVIAQVNNCNYCLAAHTVIGKMIGLKDNEIMDARKGLNRDPKQQAMLKFAKNVVEKRGDVSDRDVQELKSYGATDQELVDLVLVIVVNMFTNYFNKVFAIDIDFPQAPKLI